MIGFIDGPCTNSVQVSKQYLLPFYFLTLYIKFLIGFHTSLLYILMDPLYFRSYLITCGIFTKVYVSQCYCPYFIEHIIVSFSHSSSQRLHIQDVHLTIFSSKSILSLPFILTTDNRVDVVS